MSDDYSAKRISDTLCELRSMGDTVADFLSACAALLDSAAARQPAEGLMALRDFERCLAWAWLSEH